MSLYKAALILTCVNSCLSAASAQIESTCPSFRSFFSNCEIGSVDFDRCLTKGLNEARPCFRFGDPSLGIPILEPIFYGPDPVATTLDLVLFKARLGMFNIFEYAWANSTYLKTKTDLPGQKIDIYQFLPYKYLWGDASFDAVIMETNISRTIQWTMELFDVKQKTTIKRYRNSNKLKVFYALTSAREIKFQVKNAIYDAEVETLLNKMAHRYWKPFYELLKSALLGLVNAAQTKLANEVYPNIKLDELFKPQFKGGQPWSEDLPSAEFVY